MGEEVINIDHIQPVGFYTVRLYFDDSHNIDIYSWETPP